MVPGDQNLKLLATCKSHNERRRPLIEGMLIDVAQRKVRCSQNMVLSGYDVYCQVHLHLGVGKRHKQPEDKSYPVQAYQKSSKGRPSRHKKTQHERELLFQFHGFINSWWNALSNARRKKVTEEDVRKKICETFLQEEPKESKYMYVATDHTFHTDAHVQ